MNRLDSHRGLVRLASLPLVGVLISAHAAADVALYQSDVKPLLRERCFACHGPLRQQAGLRLDTADLMLRGGDAGPVVVAGAPDESLLITRVAENDLALRMPPEHEGEPLSVDQIATLRAWIASGASGPDGELREPDPRDHWAFQPIERTELPEVHRGDWVRNAIDAFIAAKYDEQQLTPQVEATRELLLRRVSLDLIGLPPSPAEIAAVLNDQRPDWYERVVARLLDDPRYGERWARHWMDIWRYSDWWGLGDQLRSSQLHIWHWRDWIIESLNADLPYDQMVALMLAGDEIAPHDLDQLRATGYLARNFVLFNRNQWMDQTIEHVCKALLGLTANCAKCHDHKYDPISQEDYYRLRAIFEPYHVRLDVLPGEPDLTRDGIPRVFDGQLDAPTWRYIRGDEKNPDKSQPMQPGLPEFLTTGPLVIEPVELPPEAWQPERRPWVVKAHLERARERVESAHAEIDAARKELADLESSPPASAPDDAARALEVAQLRLKTAELLLAAAKAGLQSVELRASAKSASDHDQALAHTAYMAERAARLADARLKLSKAELRVLEAGDGEREAAEGEAATARQELDEALGDDGAAEGNFTPLPGARWTPTRFTFSGEDDPAVDFPPTSSGRRKAFAQWLTDARNPLTARVAVNHIWARHFAAPLVPTVFDFGRNGQSPTHPELLDWLASELIDHGWSMKHIHRLIVESAVYRLSPSTSDAPVNLARDPQNRWLWRRTPMRLESQVVRDSLLALAGRLDLTQGGPAVPPEQQEASRRRSVYFFHSNNHRNLFLTLFDEARVTECYRRERSIVPQQALAMTNSKLVLELAPKIAQQLMQSLASAGAADDDAAFIRQAFTTLLGDQPTPAEEAATLHSLKAWRALPDEEKGDEHAHLIWVLLNHHDFVTVR